MGHIIQISSLKTHGHEELQLSLITATDLQIAQITETQIDSEWTPDFVHKQLTRDYLPDITASNPISFGSGWFQRNNHRL